VAGKKKTKRRHKAEVREAKQLARSAARLARRYAALDRKELVLAHAMATAIEAQDTDKGKQGKDSGRSALPAIAEETLATRRRALLIINSKSGPNRDSLLHVRELAEKLDALGIQADVTVKLRKKKARRDAKRAAKRGYPLVIAAGGDGTVEAVASGLIGTDTVLGVIPLGTYNNVAACLGIPTDVDAACALIATGTTRAIDVGRVLAAGMKKPKLFMEMAGAGLAAALMPVGQDVEKGRWEEAAKLLPAALSLEPTETHTFLDGNRHPDTWKTLLVEVANAPRNGPGLIASPDAAMDDGLLDVHVYDGFDRKEVASHFLALKLGKQPDEKEAHHMRAGEVEVRTAVALPVVADSKVVGTTPARFDVLPGALLVIPGPGFGLSRPANPELVETALEMASSAMAEDADDKKPSEEALIVRATRPAGKRVKGLIEAVTDAISPSKEPEPEQTAPRHRRSKLRRAKRLPPKAVGATNHAGLLAAMAALTAAAVPFVLRHGRRAR
jgi:diacylglycerol kinase (ATP)